MRPNMRQTAAAGLLALALVGTVGTVALAAPNVSAKVTVATGGPLVLTGIDAEDCGPGGHGPIANYVALVNSILGNTANGGNGILVIGANGTGPQNFWNAIGTGTGETITFGAASDSFAGYQMLAIVGSAPETCGGLTAAQNTTLTGRSGDFAAFVNTGGGLLGNTQSDFPNAQQFAYVGGVGGITSISAQYSDIDPTAEGTAVGVTNALDVCCWHSAFISFPSFLVPFAWVAGSMTQAAVIGGTSVSLPEGGLPPPRPGVNGGGKGNGAGQSSNDPNPNTNPSDAKALPGMDPATATARCRPQRGTCAVEPPPGVDSRFRIDAAGGEREAILFATTNGNYRPASIQEGPAGRPNCPDYTERNADWVQFGFLQPERGKSWAKTAYMTQRQAMTKKAAAVLLRRLQVCFAAPYEFPTRAGYRPGTQGSDRVGVLPECSSLQVRAAKGRVAPCVSARKVVKVPGGWVVRLVFRVPANAKDPKALG